MSSSSNIGNANASQVAAANPAADVENAEGLGTVPVVPGVGPEVAQLSGDGVMPDLTLLKLEELLNLDPTDDSGTAGRSLETEPLQASPEDGELPADLTSVDLDLLLELDLSGIDLPTLLEVAGLSGQIHDNEGAQNGPPEDIDPSANPLLEDENDEDGELGSDDDPGLEASSNSDTAPRDTAADNAPANDAPGNNGQSSDGGSQGNGPDSNSGQGNGAGVVVASNNNAGGNPDNVGGGGENGNAGGNSANAGGGSTNSSAGNNGGGSANSNAGANPGNNAGGAANSRAGSNPGNVGGGNTNSNAGGNAGGNPGSGAGAIAAAAAGISFPGGGELPGPITPAGVAPAADPGQAAPVSVPAGPPATVPPAHSAVTYVSSSDPADGPGNSSFGLSHGPAIGNTSTFDNPSPVSVPSPFDNVPSPVASSDTGNSNAPAASTAGLTLTGNGGADSLVGGSNADDLSGSGGSDTLEGGAGADTLSGGGGSDLLDGGAGADYLSGGGGADTLVWDFNDINIDGGGGTDTLRVDSGDADITIFGGNITSIETVDLATDAGANTLTLTAQDVLDMSGTDTLTVSGDALDSLDAGIGWSDGGVSGGNHIYTQVIGPDTATLVVDTDVTVNANILV